MKLRCTKCGNTDGFYANQALRGIITVLVDRNGDFIGNMTGEGLIDTSGLDFDDPEGPFECEKCDSGNIADDEE